MYTKKQKILGAGRLCKLAKFLLKVPLENFDMGIFAVQDSCETVACALGWCPTVFPKYWTMKTDRLKSLHSDQPYPYLNGIPYCPKYNSDESGWYGAEGFFAIETHVAARVFYPVAGNITREEVSDNLLELASKLSYA